MIEATAISVIDRLIQLVKSHQEEKRKLFVDHIEPLFLDLAQIHAGYLNDFNALSEILRPWQQGFDIESFHAEAIRRKALLEHLRVKSHVLAQVERKGIPEEAESFFGACQDYFHGASGWQDQSYHGYFSLMLDEMATMEPSDDALGECYRNVQVFLSLMRRNWSSVTEAYAAARITLL